MSTLLDLLKTTVELEGSDLHLTSGAPPVVRIHGQLHRLDDHESLTGDETKRLVYSLLADGQKDLFEEASELDIAFGIPGGARFRCNVFTQRGDVAAVYRLIPETIRSIDELGLPPVTARFAELTRGLVLVTGPTGSGKEHDARGTDRHDQHHAQRPHPDDRGPGRVPAPAQELHREPARDPH